MNDHAMIARVAFVNMPAQYRSATQRQLGQSALHMRHGLRSMFAYKIRRIVLQDVGDSRSWFGLLLSGIAQPGSCRTGSQSIGLGIAPRCVRRTCR